MENFIFIQIGEEVSLASFSIIDHPMHMMAKVLFEDGYENIFYNDVETGDWVEQDVGITTLALQTGNCLLPYFNSCYDVIKPLQWFTSGGTQYQFGYHKYLTGQFVVYEVYHPNLRYMFTAVKGNSGLWQVIMFSGDISWNFPCFLRDEIPYLIDAYQL